MPIIHRTTILAEEARDDIKEGNEKLAPYEEQPDFSTPENKLNNKNNLHLDSEQQGDVGPDIAKHPELLETAGLPAPFNPDPDVDPNLEGDAILNEFDLELSKDALRDKNKQKHKNRMALENKQKNQHKYKHTYRDKPSLPKPRPGG